MIEASSGTTKNQKIQIALQLNNGTVFGKVIEVTPQKEIHFIPLSELKVVPMVLLPRPYPGFQSYWFTSSSTEKFEKSAIEALQISFGPELKPENYSEKQGVLLHKIVFK